MQRPEVLFFDSNESMLDLSGMKPQVTEAFGGREDLMTLWFSTMLMYSLVDTVTSNYHDFGTIGAACMQMVAPERTGILLTGRLPQIRRSSPMLPMGTSRSTTVVLPTVRASSTAVMLGEPMRAQLMQALEARMFLQQEQAFFSLSQSQVRAFSASNDLATERQIRAQTIKIRTFIVF